MPLPTPNTNESKDDFISRCMGDDTTTGDFPEADQRRAVCESQWDDSKKDKGMKIIKNADKSAEILLYDDIGESWLGGISAKSFADEVNKLGRLTNINVRINSYGGSVHDGIAIYNTLKKNHARVTVDIDGIAASIASVIAMAGDEINIAANGFMMIHDPWSIAMGTADDFRHEAELMDKIRDSLLDTYMLKASTTRDNISDMMSKETWLTAQEALDIGLVTNLTGDVALAACANKEILKHMSHIPDSLLPKERARMDKTKVLSMKIQQRLKQRNL